MFRLKGGDSKDSLAVNIRNAKNTKDAITQGCQKLNIDYDTELKLFTEDGVLIFDDDLEDEDYMKELVVIMCKHQPNQKKLQEPTLPDCSEEMLPCTPSPNHLAEDSESCAEVVRLPTFSHYLHCELQKSGYKPCSDHCWRMVRRISFPFIWTNYYAKLSPVCLSCAGNAYYHDIYFL